MKRPASGRVAHFGLFMTVLLVTDVSANQAPGSLAGATRQHSQQQSPQHSPQYSLRQWQFPQQDYRRYAHQAVLELGQPLTRATPEDITDYCPAYPELSLPLRRAFWSHLLAFMAKSESNHSPSSRYQEKFNDRAGQPVISRGLLQISYESAQAYGCDLATPQSLHNPRQNLRCGVRILNRWIDGDNRLAGRASDSTTEGTQWLGGARYWSTLRDNEQHRQIRQAARSLAYCQAPLPTPAFGQHYAQRIPETKGVHNGQRRLPAPQPPLRISKRAPVPRRYLRSEIAVNSATGPSSALTASKARTSVSETITIRQKNHTRPRRSTAQ